MDKIAVITGSTRGIGYSMARAFLERGCSVVISGRTRENVDRSVEQLSKEFPPQRIVGAVCDASDPQQVEELWKDSLAAFGRVDIWVNNAGASGDPQSITDSSADQAESIVKTNLLGVIYGSQTAARGMLTQGYGSIYNMEGMGSSGRTHDGLVFYGTTKYAVCYFTRGLATELSNGPVIAGALRPGMVVTEMITRPYAGRPEEWRRVKRIFNIIAERVEVVAPWLVDQMLKNQKNGVHLAYSNGWKLLLRMIAQPFTHRDLFEEDRSTGS